MVALTNRTVARPADHELSERGLHRRERVRLCIMQQGLRRLEAEVARRDVVTGLAHEDDPVDFSTQRGVRYWPEGNAPRQFHWQDDEPLSHGSFPAAEVYARRMRRVEVQTRKSPATRRAGVVTAVSAR